MPIKSRPDSTLATPVEPDPINGSKTTSPGLLCRMSNSVITAIGFWVGWLPNDFSDLGVNPDVINGRSYVSCKRLNVHLPRFLTAHTACSKSATYRRSRLRGIGLSLTQRIKSLVSNPFASKTSAMSATLRHALKITTLPFFLTIRSSNVNHVRMSASLSHSPKSMLCRFIESKLFCFEIL